MLHEYKGKSPKLGARVYVADGAQIVGDVEIGDHSSVWYNCVIRGDVHYVRIGQHTNIQDASIGLFFEIEEKFAEENDGCRHGGPGDCHRGQKTSGVLVN